MKYTTSTAFILLVLAIFGWSCSPKTTMATEQEKVSELDEFSFLTNPAVAHSSVDSLYEFYQRIKLHPEQVHHSNFGELLWNPIAAQFISGTWLSIFDKELKLISQSNQIEQSINYTYPKLPIVVIGTSNQITFYDLEKQKNLKKYKLKGLPFKYTALPDNELKVLTTDEFKNTLIVYHFKADILIGADTLNLKHNPNLSTLHPNGEVLIDGNPSELNIINTRDLSVTKKVPLTQQCSRIGLSKEGSRLVLINQSFSATLPSTIKILSFPELEEVANYSFGKQVIYSLQNDLLLVGDKVGSVQFINVKTGETIYSTKESQQIRCLAILNEQEIVIGTYSFQKEQTKLIYRNIRTGKDLYTLDTSTDIILPIVFSSDSKQFYFYENKILSQLDLESRNIEKVIETPHMYIASISSDDKYLAFFSDYQQSLLVDLESKKTSALPKTNSRFFFGNDPNEILLVSSDSIKVYQLDTEKWVRQEKLENEKLNWLSSTKNIFPNPRNPEEVIFADHSRWPHDLIHFNKTTYEYAQPFPRQPRSPLKNISLLGLDKNGDYYLSSKWNKTYICDANTFQIIDSIPIPLNNYYNRLAATAERDALYTKRDHSTFVFDPQKPGIRQPLNTGTFFMFSPDLTYLIQTRRDVLDIYKWRDK